MLSCAKSLFHELVRWVIETTARELRNLHTWNKGELYITNGNNQMFSTTLDANFRKGWYPQKLVADVARKTHVNFTLMYLTFHDADVWTIMGAKNGRRQAEAQIHDFLRRHPNFFFLHPSPTSERTRGTLYRTVPVPHSLTEQSRIKPELRVPYNERNIRKVVWRGSTTGEYQKPYSKTDRYRMVKAFATDEMAKGRADVAYSGLCQGVKRHQLPAFGGSIARGAMMRHRVTLDVDGNSNSWEGLRWKLMAGAAVVKVRSGLGFVQWYYHRLRNGEELIETDVEHVVRESMRVLDNATLGAHLAKQALAFGDKYLTHAAINEAVWDLVGNVWRYGYDFEKDWRIQP